MSNSEIGREGSLAGDPHSPDTCVVPPPGMCKCL